MNTYSQVVGILRNPKNYVPRNYQSIGGMWTVDTWRLGEATLQIMDEGYTTIIKAQGLKVIRSYVGRVENIRYEEGSESDMVALLNRL